MGGREEKKVSGNLHNHMNNDRECTITNLVSSPSGVSKDVEYWTPAAETSVEVMVTTGCIVVVLEEEEEEEKEGSRGEWEGKRGEREGEKRRRSTYLLLG